MRRAAPVLGIVAAAGLLAGCTSSAPPAVTASTVTVVAQSTPSASSSALPTAPSTAATTATPTSIASGSTTPSPVSSQRGGGRGCAPNGASVPAGADTATVGDVDETDSDATEFFSETPGFAFGVRTASGATIVLPDDLAGPATHSGWITRFPLAVVAVIDDGRGATLHAFVDCRFVQTKGVDGRPYSFALDGFGTVGTGVGCASYVDGTKELVGLDAVRLPNGRYRIDSTEVRVSADGRTATNGTTKQGTTTYARDSVQVRQAERSSCGDVPIVHTSGR